MSVKVHATNTYVSVKLRGKRKALQEMGRKSKRLNQWEPIARDMEQIFIDDLKRFYARKYKVGQMKNLGPSVIETDHPEHYFFVKDGDSAAGLTKNNKWKNRAVMEFGTEVEYARTYSWWRVKNPNGPGRGLMVACPKARKLMADLIVRWVATGKKYK